ncbi:hypothetical protein VKS41_002184 [Umbelopsis sp. WA50703]|jgi:nicotinate phosphoribosyltransferase
MNNRNQGELGLASILDNDLYKFSMQQVVFKNYRDAVVNYKFTNRTRSMKLNQQAVEWLKNNVKGKTEVIAD